MRISLDGKWDLRYRLETKDMPDIDCWDKIAADVPGNIELDLYSAGIEKDPFFGENIYDYRKYEFYTFVYERDFDMSDERESGRVLICFEGINTYADIFVNGALVGKSDNMLIGATFDITSAVRSGKNSVRVVIRSAMNIARNRDYAVSVGGNDHGDDYVWQRKPPHSFGWDIMPRFPSAGLWRGAYITTEKPTRITQAYFATMSATEKRAEVIVKFRYTTDADVLEGFSVRATIGSVVKEIPTLFISGDMTLTIDNPKLWWPRGYGEQSLYDAKLELLHNGNVIDTYKDRIGIRFIEIDHKMLPGDDGEFLIKVNGVKILAKGSNWVPLDAMHSRDASRYDRALKLFYEAGCNIARCWGGNVYEDHRFYELCDEYGILVWQDFTMACAVYPQDSEFLTVIEREAEYIIRKLRNHPSILLWAGDNEVDEGYIGRGYAPETNRYNAITREALPRAVRQNDPFRAYIPSSPYIDFGVKRYMVPEQHNWGARAYFKDDFYKHTNAHFISECGYHGCPAPESLAKFIPADKLWDYKNSAWDTHDTDYMPKGGRGYNRNQLMADQVEIMFGEVPDNLEEFSKLSQVVQAEAKKFFIERTRVKKWRRTGIIWWNMLDGWPQISDAVVDYYFTKKRAFNYIKRVQEPICVIVDELVDWENGVFLANDSRVTASVSYRLVDGDTGEVLLSGRDVSPANENVKIGGVRTLAGTQRLILIEWFVDGKRYVNHYVTGYPAYDKRKFMKWLDIIDSFAEE